VAEHRLGSIPPTKKNKMTILSGTLWSPLSKNEGKDIDLFTELLMGKALLSIAGGKVNGASFLESNLPTSFEIKYDF
jgi:hypothetical protein